MKKCVFCQIVKRELPASVIFEDEGCIVFSPLGPVTKGHIIIASKKHFKNIFDINTNVLMAIIAVAQKIVRNVTKKNKATGINLLHASGKDAQQSTFHFHLHLVPRYPNDSLDLWLKNKL